MAKAIIASRMDASGVVAAFCAFLSVAKRIFDLLTHCQAISTVTSARPKSAGSSPVAFVPSDFRVRENFSSRANPAVSASIIAGKTRCS